MAIHVALHHVTHYKYDRPISLGPQVVRLRPAPHCRTPILSYSLKITPTKHFINWQQDPQSNYMARLVFEEKTAEFRVEVDLVAEMTVYNPFDFFLEPDAERYPFNYEKALEHELAPFRLQVAETPKFDAYATAIIVDAVKLPPPPVAGLDARPRTIDALVYLNQKLWKDIKYGIRMEPGVQTPEETLTLRSGSCRDTAWLMVGILRKMGFAARFVSGYLIQLKPDVKSLDGPSGAEVDFTDLHAWCEVYLPGAGWVGLDPTSGMLASEGHIPVAATPDPQSAAPISGGVELCETEFSHEMTVTRVLETPRVTKPYTPEQWAAIDALGLQVDADLAAHDVRLTMGGEPTFVSIDDPDGAEWNYDAIGEKKRLLSGELVKRLRHKFGPGGLLHYGIGKWYPGEPLPRWGLACHWRKDGQPVWLDDSLIADESKSYGHTEDDALAFGQTLSALLEVDPQHLVEGREDVYYYLWKERSLPANVDPLKSNLKDELERARLRRLFEQGLEKVVGYALPLQKTEAGWCSGPWFLRDDRLWLIPGDSPMGLRLPLESLPWVSEVDYPWFVPADPMQMIAPLQPRHLPSEAARHRNGPPLSMAVMEELKGQRAKLATAASKRPAEQESASWIIRTALCIEPRDGRLYIFMPPLAETDDYLELVAAIEETARTLGLPIILEGSPPAYDPRLQSFKITPDPGVIEVNLQPAANWTEIVHNTTVLYEEARLTRLATEKFMLDGRHTGTGGGNHIVMGGETPADSPMLRRPDLLRSLLSYWHNHPSLSYLFSGLFIGPTSQSPRVDEARNDSIYELETAFAKVPSPAGQVPPWLVDRLFRNLLVDLTGNTHRTEFSIDKLFSPDSSTGRLGLVELRSFEMPPHAEMSLAQHLLLRAAIARFWQDPFETKLVRWGTELHDRFLLPHFIWDDFVDVIADFQGYGYELKPEWFAPHFEFRCPTIGTFTQRNVQVELRTALEPWNVLGEEPAGGGNVRFVDSSLERLQVKVSGMIDNRHLISCNGRQVPLHPTGTVGEYVAGVKYRAWQPPSCLHPTIPSHAPLTFDLLDTWNKRSLGGCTYHVAHPGGLSYGSFPVNAYEAESRRLSRFLSFGHTPGGMTVPKSEINPEFPFTLDLRQGS